MVYLGIVGSLENFLQFLKYGFYNNSNGELLDSFIFDFI